MRSLNKIHRSIGGLKTLVLPAALGCMLALGAVGTRALSTYQQAPDSLAAQKIALGSSDNSKWAIKALQYKSWAATLASAENTKYGGSGFRDYLAADPKLVVLFAGYPFANEYNQARGHANAVSDVTSTKRRNEMTPATCWSCKSPDVPRLMLRDGVGKFYAQKFDHYQGEVKNSIGCADCHNPKTYALQISRPALIEAYQRQGKDIKKATHDEMRSLVCAQCHVEYYFKGKDDKYLTFPWEDGYSPEAFEKYYARVGHTDWTHAISGAKMVKMQHPDFEVYQQSVHFYAGVSCADCHMPRVKSGNAEYSSHQVRSPLYSIDQVCANCHSWTPQQIRNRVYAIQDKNRELLDRAQAALTFAHLEIGDAAKLGASDTELEGVRKQVSNAQMYWDYVAANNGMGFHAPQELARVLGKAIDMAQDCRQNVARIRNKHGAPDPLPAPDLGDKAKAQAFIKPFVDAQKAKEAAAQPVKPPAR